MKKQLLAVSALTLALPSLSMGALVAWYPLDSDASDASGNGHNGSVEGGTVNFGQAGANGATGNSAAFPDAGRIDVPYSSALNPGSYTVTLWANASSTAGFASPITSRDDVGAGVTTHGFILYNNASGLWDFWTGDGDPGWDTLPGGAVSVSTWSHLAITYDSGTDTKTLWVDGVISATNNVPQSGPTQYSPNGPEMENLHIGGGGDGGNEFSFSGGIDDVTIWDEALDAAAIQDIMNNSVTIPEPASLGLLSLARPRSPASPSIGLALSHFQKLPGIRPWELFNRAGFNEPSPPFYTNRYTFLVLRMEIRSFLDTSANAGPIPKNRQTKSIA